MSIRLKEDEAIVTQCQLQEFTATLTNARLIITSSTSEENFPLRGLSGIGVYDDVDGYQSELKAAKKKSTGTIIGMSSGVGFLLMFIMIANGAGTNAFLAMIGVLTVGFFIAFSQTPDIRLESLLNIMQHGGSRQFRFYKTGSNVIDIKKFVEQVTDTLS